MAMAEFIFGMFFGATVGVLIFSLLIASKDGKDGDGK